MQRHIYISFLIIAAFVLLVLTLPGCAPGNPHQTEGFLLPVALQRACVSGKVTDAVTGRGVHGVKLLVVPPIAGPEIKTNRDGFFYAEFPGGSYRLSFVKGGYRDAEQTVLLKPGETAGRDVSLDPVAPVIVDAGKTVTGAAPGSTVTVKAKVTVRDGSPPEEIRWQWKADQEEGGVTANVAKDDGPAVRVRLPGIEEYKRALFYRLGKDGRLHDRWMVVGITPSDLMEAGRVTLKVAATTASKTYTDSVDIIADLSSIAAVNPGLQNVATGKPVLLHGNNQPSHAWSLTAPTGSAAALRGATTQNPSFTPDVTGTYVVREGNRERLTIYAGHWIGAAVAKETDIRERWIGKDGCLCHFNDPVTPKFRAWRTSGHAEIFSRGVNTIFRYEENCFVCHTVGFGGKAPDGGISSDSDYPTFLKDPILWDHGKTPPVVRPRPGNLDFILDSYPGVARFANVQCENCHGPNSTPAHDRKGKKTVEPARVSLTADVCGICHDESQEDFSFRQWLEEKKHANYGLAITTATVDGQGELAGDCGRCHAGQGFLAWVARGDRSAMLAKPGSATARKELAALGLTKEKVHPVTCAICHEPHNPGSTFRSATEKVPVRTADYTRMHPQEFRNDTGGRGAVCITCHSTIWGAYNDVALPRIGTDVTPHVCQSDVMFGQNAFFTNPGAFKSHARIEDTCVWCHVKPVPNPPEQGYPRRNAGHTFKADAGSCASAKCHDFKGDELMVVVERDTESLKGAIEAALAGQIGRKGGVRLAKAGAGEADVSLAAADLRKIRLTEIGRSMAIEVATADGVYKAPLGRVGSGDESLLSTETGQIIVKAAWNYFLVKRDGSKGAHNPQFVREVLDATLKRVKELQK